jgi:hypothetical protein
MIVKCQRGLGGNAGYANQMMVYTQDREQLAEFVLSREWEKLFERYGPKFYAEVEWPNSHVRPLFIAKLDDQQWGTRVHVRIGIRKP